MIDKFVRELRVATSAVAARIAFRKPIQHNKLVFSAWHGAGYACNPKYITESLIERGNSTLDIVWLTRKYDTSIPASVRQVPYASLRAARELATAKVWVDNCRTRRYIPKKPGQFYLQTWHGCLSPKRLEADIEPILTKTYIKGAQQDSQDADLFICNNEFFAQILRDSFWYDGPILSCGLPRNRPLLHPNEQIRAHVRRSLGVPDGFALCLYVPTFRDDGSTEVFRFDHGRCCQALEQRFGKPFLFAVRLHPNLRQKAVGNSGGQVLDVSDYSDAIELLCAADVLITDYSSMAEDFALLGRPGYLFMPDYDACARTRGGFYYPYDVRPFPAAFSEDGLVEIIHATPDDEFSIRREAFFDMVGFQDDGNGAFVVADVLERIVAGEPVAQIIDAASQYNKQ